MEDYYDRFSNLKFDNYTKNYQILDYPSYSEQNLMSGGGLSENSLYLLYAILFIIVIFVVYKINYKYDNLMYRLNRQHELQEQQFLRKKMQEIKEKEDENENQDKQISVNVNNQQVPVRSPFEMMREYDYRTLNDPLVAPRRRDDYNLPVLPYPTRGLPAPYKKVGILIDKSAHNNDRYKILLLMGRNTYPSSNVFDYYALENDKNSSLKFDINKTRELQTDDKVEIKELGKVYTVITDRMLEYSYDPYIG